MKIETTVDLVGHAIGEVVLWILIFHFPVLLIIFTIAMIGYVLIRKD